MTETIICPSGLTGRIRGMKVREERILTDRKLARNGNQVEELLKNCWEETADAGPYDFGDQNIDWTKVLQGDRFFALLQIRALTYGPEYTFSVPCQNQACRARVDWELNLSELPVRKLSDESREVFIKMQQRILHSAGIVSCRRVHDKICGFIYDDDRLILIDYI